MRAITAMLRSSPVAGVCCGTLEPNRTSGGHNPMGGRRVSETAALRDRCLVDTRRGCRSVAWGSSVGSCAVPYLLLEGNSRHPTVTSSSRITVHGRAFVGCADTGKSSTRLLGSRRTQNSPWKTWACDSGSEAMNGPSGRPTRVRQRTTARPGDVDGAGPSRPPAWNSIPRRGWRAARQGHGM